MKPFIPIGIFLLGVFIISCGKDHSYDQRTKATEIETYEVITLDSFFIDHNEVNSNEWKEYQRNSSYNNSSIQIEI